jgi:hypothetical protein
MTKSRYLEMQKQLDRAPDPNKTPPDVEDFPESVQQALYIFNILGDRVASDIGYIGKDYSLLPAYLPDIDNKELFLEVLAWLDSKVIKKSSEDMKRARDKAKR